MGIATAMAIVACAPPSALPGDDPGLTCPVAPEHEVWTDAGVSGNSAGSGTSQIIAADFGVLSSSASTSWPADDEGPAAWADLGWRDAVLLIPSDAARADEFVSLSLHLTATLTIAGVDDRGAVAGFAGATATANVALSDDPPGTYSIPITDELTVRLGTWSPMEVEAWAQTRDAWDRSSAGTNSAFVAVHALGFGTVRDAEGLDVPIALLCTASGADYSVD